MGWKGASMSIPRGGGCCKSVVPSVSLALGDSVHDHVCLQFVMSNSCNVWGPLAKESIPLKHVLGWGGSGGGSQGGKLTLNSLLRTWLSLKHPLSFRAFKQLECMDKSRVSFWWTWMFLLLIRNQEESHLKRTMGKCWVSWWYLL